MKRITSSAAVILLGMALSASALAQAKDQKSAPVKFKVVSTSVVTEIKSGSNKWSTKDPATSKGLVMVIEVTVPSDTSIWATDLATAYQSKGESDRAKCVGLSAPTSSPDEDGGWVFGDYSEIKLKKGVRYFKALFGCENDVNEVSLLYKQPVVPSVPVNRK